MRGSTVLALRSSLITSRRLLLINKAVDTDPANGQTNETGSTRRRGPSVIDSRSTGGSGQCKANKHALSSPARISFLQLFARAYGTILSLALLWARRKARSRGFKQIVKHANLSRSSAGSLASAVHKRTGVSFAQSHHHPHRLPRSPILLAARTKAIGSKDNGINPTTRSCSNARQHRRQRAELELRSHCHVNQPSISKLFGLKRYLHIHAWVATNADVAPFQPGSQCGVHGSKSDRCHMCNNKTRISKFAGATNGS
ncbi:uncharacterized protein SPSC_01522 [Sporisorium scitamineum]|uniref:Uncharacterized protein n=1 Tax=Sporisorium scitamineum TaxID=49012 RepID=A0A127ZA98_9BASI|nr:uncharacterized protein SPSC_01522 [Sporisorium scitamineum]